MSRIPFNFIVLVMGVLLLAWAISLAGTGSGGGGVGYATFLEDLKAGRVQEVRIRAGDLRLQGTLSDGSTFTTYLPSPPDPATLEAWVRQGVRVQVDPPGGNSPAGFLWPLLLVGLLFAAFFY
ncbi:MAG: cell division protein FtsH, partial [Thermus sp.]